MRGLYAVLMAVLCLGISAKAQTNVPASLQHQENTRTFLIHLPPGYSTTQSLPVVFVLHGGGSIGSSSQIQNYTKFDQVADTASIICVYPQALNSNWADGRGNQSDEAGVDDVGYFAKMIDYLRDHYNINTQRVYSCGISNGGFMTERLAIELGNKLAAVGTVAASLSEFLANNFSPVRKIPVMMINGTNDRFVPYDGGSVIFDRGEIISAEASIAKWLTFNGCGTETSSEGYNSNKLDLSSVTKYTYPGCDNGADVWFYKVTGGGHTWPGATAFPVLGTTNKDIHASHELWKFFRGRTLNSAIRKGSEQGKTVEVSLFPNPAFDQFTITGTGINPADVEIYNALGKRQNLKGTFNSDAEYTFNIEDLAKGVYLVKALGKTFRVTKQ